MTARIRIPTRLTELLADDRALLARFSEQRDDAAFAAIVKRYGGLVLGVCRRAVRDAHLAEDAFQAAFLVLARNPQAAVRATSVAGWLFGVARRVGLAARRHEERRQKRERRAGTESRPDESPHDWDDLLCVVDEELARIPDENRAALIACFLREQTHDEAARELGWSLSTLRRRLDRGKELLRARLTRRGATLSAGLFAGWLAPSTAVAVPRELTTRAGVEANASPMALELAAKVIGSFALGKLVPVMLAVFLVAGFAASFDAPKVEEPREAASIAAPVPEALREWVTVTGQVQFPENRDLPERREIVKTDGFVKDAECCFADGRRLFHDNVIVDAKTRAIANAVVWLRPDLEGPKVAFPADKIHPKHAKPEAKERTIDVVDCQFQPRITVARAGDTLLFKNPAPLATNVRYDINEKGPGAKFGGFNVLLAAKTGSTSSPGPVVSGTRPDAFSSSIYTWMKGYVWAFDHPYATVTDASGKFTIPNAPVGKWRLVMWHEEYGFSGTYAWTAVTIEDVPGGTKLGTREFKIR